MTTATINEVKENLLAFVRKAAAEEIVLLHEGRPIGVIEGFADDDDVDEHRLLNDPRFQSMIARSRQEFKDGKVTRLEDME
jgi:hypothetical protein